MQEWVAIGAFGISLAGLLAASYSDIRERLVDDKISYGMVAVGLLLFSANALLNSEWVLLGWSVLAGIATFAAGYWLWRIGFWAGGDVKLFTGLAVLNPFNWMAIGKLSGFSVWKTVSLPIFPLSLFLASALVLLPVGLVLLVGKAIAEPQKFKTVFSNPAERLLSIVFSALALSAFSFWQEGNQSILLQWGIPSLAVIIGLVLGLGWIEKKTKKLHSLKLVLCTGLLAIGLWFWQVSFLADSILLAVVLGFLAILFSLFFSNRLFRSDKLVEELKEGDIPAKTVVEKGMEIVVRKEAGFLEIIKNLKNQELVQEKREREICSSRRAGGLEKEQIKELQELAKKGRIPKTFEIKESTAFVPAVLVAYLLLNALGDPLLLL